MNFCSESILTFIFDTDFELRWVAFGFLKQWEKTLAILICRIQFDLNRWMSSDRKTDRIGDGRYTKRHYRWPTQVRMDCFYNSQEKPRTPEWNGQDKFGFGKTWSSKMVNETFCSGRPFDLTATFGHQVLCARSWSRHKTQLPNAYLG